MAEELKQVAIRMVEAPPLYSDRPMNCPAAVVEVMNDFLKQMDRELLCVVNMNAQGKPINMNIVSMGSVNQSIAHPREIFKSSILSNAANIMLIHNHPSGSLEPSEADIQMTVRLHDAAEIMGITLLDSIIVGGRDEYFSFMEKEPVRFGAVTYATSLDEVNLRAAAADNRAAYIEEKETSVKDRLLAEAKEKAASQKPAAKKQQTKEKGIDD